MDVWSLDFEFRILDCFSLPSLCGSPKRSCLEFGFWSLCTVWILHKIIDGLRKTGDAPGHKPRLLLLVVLRILLVVVVVVVVVVGSC